jgi:SMI1 / KNR4 family (SUKH-1)
MISMGDMKRLCDTLDAAQREYLIGTYQMRVDVASVYKRFAPATAREIAKLEKQFGMKCPPSYRTFLKIQNGWRRFGLGWSLLGAQRPESKDLHAIVKQTLGQSGAVTTEEERTELLEKEKKDPRLIHPAHHWIIGTDANFNLLLFDRNRVAKNGEPQVVSSRYLIHVDCRWKNFEAFFRDVLSRVEKHVRDLRARAKREAEKMPRSTGASAASGKRAARKAKPAPRK